MTWDRHLRHLLRLQKKESARKKTTGLYCSVLIGFENWKPRWNYSFTSQLRA
jgi:hypothetical protein